MSAAQPSRTTAPRRSRRARGRRRRGKGNFLALLFLDNVVDVPVIINDEFLQYMTFKNLEVPQIDVREPGGASDSVHLHTLRIPVVTQRQVPTVHSFMFPVQFLDMVLDMPIEVPRQLLGSMVQKTVVPQLPSIEGRRHSFRAAEADPDGPDYSADHTDSAVAVLFLLVGVPVVRVVQILRCRRGEDIRAPTVAARRENRRPLCTTTGAFLSGRRGRFSWSTLFSRP